MATQDSAYGSVATSADDCSSPGVKQDEKDVVSVPLDDYIELKSKADKFEAMGEIFDLLYCEMDLPETDVMGFHAGPGEELLSAEERIDILGRNSRQAIQQSGVVYAAWGKSITQFGDHHVATRTLHMAYCHLQDHIRKISALLPMYRYVFSLSNAQAQALITVFSESPNPYYHSYMASPNSSSPGPVQQGSSPPPLAVIGTPTPSRIHEIFTPVQNRTRNARAAQRVEEM